MSATFLYCVIKRTFLIVSMFLLSSREEDGKKIASTHYFIHLSSLLIMCASGHQHKMTQSPSLSKFLNFPYVEQLKPHLGRMIQR